MASQVTRSSDSAEMTSTNFSSWFNQAEGTVYSEMASNMSFATAGVNKVGWQIDSGSGQSNRFNWNHTASSLAVVLNGSVVASFDNTDAVINTFYKNAFAYRTNDFANSFNAGTVGTDTLGALPIMARLRIGDQGSNDAVLNGTIKKIACYPKKLTNAELQGLTTV